MPGCKKEFQMKVLIISCDLRISTPAGAAYIAGAAQHAGHIVEVFDAYLADDLSKKIRIRYNLWIKTGRKS